MHQLWVGWLQGPIRNRGGALHELNGEKGLRSVLLVLTRNARPLWGPAGSSFLRRLATVDKISFRGAASLQAPLQLQWVSNRNLRLLTTAPSTAPRPRSIRVVWVSSFGNLGLLLRLLLLPSLLPVLPSLPFSDSHTFAFQAEGLVKVVQADLRCS